MCDVVNKRASVARAVKRARERRSRQRREMKTQRMHEELDLLECVVAVSCTLDDDDDVWEEFLDAKARCVRRVIRGTKQLQREAIALLHERARLQRLLREHQRLEHMIARMQVSDEWSSQVRQWRAAVKRHYTPWTLTDCQAEVDEAFQQCTAFQWSTDKHTTGLSFLGWRDHQRIDHERGLFQFQFHKIHYGYDIVDYVDTVWRSQTDTDTFFDVTRCDRSSTDHEVIQKLGPNMVIARTVRRLEDTALNVHMVFLVVRIEHSHGVTLCVKSLCCPELLKAIDGPQHMWASMSSWFQWERIQGEDAFRLRIGGSIGGTDMNYLSQWMTTMFGNVLRSEQLATNRHLLTSDSIFTLDSWS